jgi:CelD/BcsL family acetyltransferase involved in cellulose biosynthesis
MTSRADTENDRDLPPVRTAADPVQRSAENGLVGQIVQAGALSQSDQEAWRTFLAPQPAAFLSYPYVGVLASHFPLVRITRIMASDGQVVAFFPFQYRCRAFAAAGIGQQLGRDLSDYFGLVAAPGVQIAPKTLMRLSGLKSLYFTHLDECLYSGGLVSGKPEIGHRIDFPQGGEAFWEEKRRDDKKFVSDTERRERKLIREYGAMRFTFCEEHGEAALSDLIARKRAQYHRTGVTDSLRDPRTRSVLHALCDTRDEQCRGMVSTLYAGDTWVASHFGLRSGSTLHYWFPVYNPELKSFAPGRILLKQIILDAQLHGLARIDRGAGDSVAKRDFATSQHFFHSGLWQQPGVTAQAHRIGLAIGWRMARYLRPRSGADHE